MNNLHIKSQNQINKKDSIKFFGVLQRLAKSDTSIYNKMKVTVYKEDNIEEKKQILIAPSMFMKYHENYINHVSTSNTIKNINENLIKENENSSPQNPELINYPDSSDFGDDNE